MLVNMDIYESVKCPQMNMQGQAYINEGMHAAALIKIPLAQRDLLNL